MALTDGLGSRLSVQEVRDMRRSGFLVVAALMFVAACGDDPSDNPDKDTSSSSPTPAEPRSGTFKLSSGESINYWCDGEGSPGVLLEAGTDSGGTDAYPAAFVDPLIAETTVCAYDRPGTGQSDPPPKKRRTMRELCAVQDQVVEEVALRAPYVLVGQSGGGNLNIGCAARNPGRVAALVTIDSYHDDPDDLRAEGFVWNDNPEFVDYIHYSKELDKLTMPIGDFPVLVISATDADPGGEKNQSHWLGLSPQSRQVTIEGPHDLQEVAPEQVVAEILKDLRGL
jgi:pimeloyl-ACP methyl ester carboxylesterase